MYAVYTTFLQTLAHTHTHTHTVAPCPSWPCQIIVYDIIYTLIYHLYAFALEMSIFASGRGATFDFREITSCPYLTTSPRDSLPPLTSWRWVGARSTCIHFSCSSSMDSSMLTWPRSCKMKLGHVCTILIFIILTSASHIKILFEKQDAVHK